LIAQSLVATDFSHGEARYHLLEITRQYARERLDARSESDELSRRHAMAYLKVAERLDRDWYVAHEATWFFVAEAELDNFRAALGWTLGKANALDLGCRITAAMARIWYSLSPLEGRRWVRLALGSQFAHSEPSVLAFLYLADAELSGALGEYSARLASARQALELRASLDDLQAARAEQAAGSALSGLGMIDEGEVFLSAALTNAARMRNRRLQGLVLGELGTARSRSGDIENSRKFFAEVLSHYLPLGF